MRGWLIAGAAGCAAVFLPGVAWSKSLPDRQVNVTGSLTYEWHGDPARGCRADGVCGVTGAITLTPDSGGDLEFTGHQPALLNLSGSFTVRVRRTAGADVGVCLESPGWDGATLALHATGRHLTASAVEPLPVSHCAGPLARDLMRPLLGGRELARGWSRFTLRSRAPVVSGPYSGEVISTLAVLPAQVGQGSGSTSTGPPSGPTAPRRVRRLVERVDVRYRAVFPASTETITFSGPGEGTCDAFDSCGVSGTIDVALPASSLNFRVLASRVVRHRVGRAAALADLAAGRLGIDGPPFNGRALGATVTEHTTRAGVPDCQATRSRVPFTFEVNPFVVPHFGRDIVLDVRDTSVTSDDLRTYCPGPTNADIAGTTDPGPLLAGHFALRSLGPRRVPVTLTANGTFRALPFSGRRGGRVSVILERTHLVAGTRWERLR